MAGKMPPPAPLGIVLVPARAKNQRITKQTVIVLMRLQILDPFLPLLLRERVEIPVETARHRRISGAVKGGLRHGGCIAIAAMCPILQSHRLDVVQGRCPARLHQPCSHGFNRAQATGIPGTGEDKRVDELATVQMVHGIVLHGAGLRRIAVDHRGPFSAGL